MELAMNSPVPWGFQGLWCAVSDPVDPLAKTAYLESNKNENGVWDGKGLRAVPLPPEGEQQGQCPGGQGGGHVGLEADLPHFQVGGD